MLPKNGLLESDSGNSGVFKEGDLIKIKNPLKYAGSQPINDLPPEETMNGYWTVTNIALVQGWQWIWARSGKWQVRDWEDNFEIVRMH